LKNSQIEQLIFQEFLKVKNLKVINLVYSDHPDINFELNNKKIGVELSEILDERHEEEIKIAKSGGQALGYSFGPEYTVDKIRKCLIKKLNKDYSVPGHEIWLLCYTNHVTMQHMGKIFGEMPQIEALVFDFLARKRDVNRVIIFEMGLKEVVLEISRS
jgi:hypothetical protein